MKRDDVRLGHAAEDLARGELSERELDLAEALPVPTPRELAEDLLYLHLTVARDRRLRMDSATEWNGDYAALYREREHAIAQATSHYRALLAMGAPLSPTLLQLIGAEGLKP